MKKGISDYGEYWIYSGMEPTIGEHWFIELTVDVQGQQIHVQVDYFNEEYTLSASEDSARSFFDEAATAKLEMPRTIEMFDRVPDPHDSLYVSEYRQAKELLDRERGIVDCRTVSEGMEALRTFLKKRRR